MKKSIIFVVAALAVIASVGVANAITNTALHVGSTYTAITGPLCKEAADFDFFKNLAADELTDENADERWRAFIEAWEAKLTIGQCAGGSEATFVVRGLVRAFAIARGMLYGAESGIANIVKIQIGDEVRYMYIGSLPVVSPPEPPLCGENPC